MLPKGAQRSNEQKELGGTFMNETGSNREKYVDNLTAQVTSHQPPSPTKPNAIFKAPDDPIPIVDLRPETSQKRTGARKYIETLGVSAVTAKYFRQIMSEDTKEAPCSFREKLAPKGTHNTLRPQALGSESHYDNTSTANSIPVSNSISTGRIRRSETERKQYFRNEPQCGSFKAHRAMCTRCRRWVRLSTGQPYSVKPWQLHRIRCDQKMPVKPTYKNLGLVANPFFKIPGTEKVRKVLLELDDTASTVEPERIKCTSCQKWVFMEKKYGLKNWAVHKSACNNNLNPADIVKALGRKLYFFCDNQFKCFLNPHLVECAICDQRIVLDPNIDYDIQAWLLHKKYCQPDSESHQGPEAANNMPSASVEAATEAGSTQADHPIPVFRTRSMISDAESVLTQAQPMSTTDSEHTLIPSFPAAASGSSILMSPLLPNATTTPGSLKRKRSSFADEPQLFEGMNMDGEPPVRRPRAESYTIDDNPKGLGWFLLPFKAFATGFKQSLTISK